MTPPGQPGDRRRGPATIEDVAEAAGVSVATVSRALRDLPNVAAATKLRVHEAAQRLHYRPDPHASRLATGRTHAIGMAVPYIERWYFAQVVGGVESVLAAEGIDVLLYAIDGEEARRRFLTEAMPFRKRVDGLVVVDLRLSPAEAAQLADQDVRLVTIGLDTAVHPAVTVDNDAATIEAVEHLVGLGHTRVGFIGGDPAEYNPPQVSVPEVRRHAFQTVMATHGLTPDPRWMLDGRFTIDGGREAMTRLLSLDERPSAVFAASDEMAMGSIVAAREAGVSIPGDLSLVGFDDHDASDALGLTTVRQHAFDIGAISATLLLDVLAGRPVQSVRHRTDLIVRSTTAPFEPVGSGEVA
ncbi:MAG: LacI family DNA-binding transcriptional regulator [Acidimicrobiales bacterium]